MTHLEKYTAGREMDSSTPENNEPTRRTAELLGVSGLQETPIYPTRLRMTEDHYGPVRVRLEFLPAVSWSKKNNNKKTDTHMMLLR